MAAHAVIGRSSVVAAASASASRCRVRYLGRLRPAARLHQYDEQRECE